MNFGITEDNKITSYNDIKDFAKNPFVEELVISVTKSLKRFKKGEAVTNENNDLPLSEINKLTEENETLKEKGIEIGQIKTRQKANFVLLYTPCFDYRQLSEISFKIFFYILESKLNLGHDCIVLNIEECCFELNATRPTITKGFVQLVRNKIISKRYDNVWWINPNYFYAGNRLNINTK